MTNRTPKKAEEAKTLLEQLNPDACELSDDALDDVAGGAVMLGGGRYDDSDDEPNGGY